MGNFVPGGEIAAGYQGDQLDIFCIDRDGVMQVFWITGSGNWGHGPMPGGTGLTPGGSIAIGGQANGSQLDVFAIDSTGSMQVFWVLDKGSWSHGAMPNGQLF